MHKAAQFSCDILNIRLTCSRRKRAKHMEAPNHRENVRVAIPASEEINRHNKTPEQRNKFRCISSETMHQPSSDTKQTSYTAYKSSIACNHSNLELHANSTNGQPGKTRPRTKKIHCSLSIYIYSTSTSFSSAYSSSQINAPAILYAKAKSKKQKFLPRHCEKQNSSSESNEH